MSSRKLEWMFWFVMIGSYVGIFAGGVMLGLALGR